MFRVLFKSNSKREATEPVRQHNDDTQKQHWVQQHTFPSVEKLSWKRKGRQVSRSSPRLSTVLKYSNRKYQTCDPVSKSRNWKPSGVMLGNASPSSLLNNHNSHNSKLASGWHKHCSLIIETSKNQSYITIKISTYHWPLVIHKIDLEGKALLQKSEQFS